MSYQRLSQRKPVLVMDARRDFVFVDDLVDLVLMAVDGRGGTGAYHVTTGRDYAIAEVLEETLKQLDLQGKVTHDRRDRSPDDARSIFLDPTRTRRDSGWRVTAPLSVGVGRTFARYKKNTINQAHTHLKLPPASGART